MKRNLIPAYIILLAIILFAFSTCKKDTRKCEKWEVNDYTQPRCVTGFCFYGSGTKQVNICESDLKNASIGNTIVIVDNDCCKTTRTFIQKL